MEIFKVEYDITTFCPTNTCWTQIYEGRLIYPTTTAADVFVPYIIGQPQFPYRTLTCGAQESEVVDAIRCINDYFR